MQAATARTVTVFVLSGRSKQRNRFLIDSQIVAVGEINLRKRCEDAPHS
jgi:hypothetical protein